MTPGPRPGWPAWGTLRSDSSAGLCGSARQRWRARLDCAGRRAEAAGQEPPAARPGGDAARRPAGERRGQRGRAAGLGLEGAEHAACAAAVRAECWCWCCTHGAGLTFCSQVPPAGWYHPQERLHCDQGAPLQGAHMWRRRRRARRRKGGGRAQGALERLGARAGHTPELGGERMRSSAGRPAGARLPALWCRPAVFLGRDARPACSRPRHPWARPASLLK